MGMLGALGNPMLSNSIKFEYKRVLRPVQLPTIASRK